MDVVISTHAGKYQEIKLRYCRRGLTHFGSGATHQIGGEAGSGAHSDFERLASLSEQDNLSEHFIFLPDSCILLHPFTPARYVNTGMLQRRPQETELMTNTIRFLLDREGLRKPLYDFELDIPMVFEKSKVREMAEMVPHMDMLPRTLYCNLFPEPMIRIVNPRIDLWSHNDDPELAVLSLSDTALAHKQCQRWLERKLPEVAQPSVAVR